MQLVNSGNIPHKPSPIQNRNRMELPPLTSWTSLPSFTHLSLSYIHRIYQTTWSELQAVGVLNQESIFRVRDSECNKSRTQT